MVRLLFSFLILMSMSAHASAAAGDDLYLSSAQKAALSLGLKAVLLKSDGNVKKDDAEYIVKSMVARAKFLASQEKRAVEVASFEEFIELQKNDQLYQNKLANIEIETLLEVMPDPLYTSRSERVQRRINKYYGQKLKMGQLVAASAFGVTFDFANGSEAVKVEDFQVYVREKINAYTDGFIQRMTKDAHSPYVNLVAKLLKMYFELLPTSQKAEILFHVMQLPLKPDVNQVFLTMIQNVGPQMQKLVQLVGRHEAIPAEFAGIFQKLESQGQPVPWSEVKKIVSPEINLDDYSYFEKLPLGVGTMAQTHRVQKKGATTDSRTTVIRFLKPGIEKLVGMDHQILVQIANELDSDPEFKKYKLPSLRPQINDVHESVTEELELIRTEKNQIEAKGIYEKSIPISFSGQKNILEIHVPSAEIIGKHKILMQQELVFGKKVDSEIANYKQAYPELYPAVAEKITELWFDQAFFKTGFFHADLHAGNMLMKVTDDRVQVNLLDFGMAGHLTQQQRDSVLMLALGIKLNNSGLIADSFSNLTRYPLAGEQKNIFANQVAQRVQQIKAGVETENSIEAWALWSVAKGLDLHYEFAKLNRGITAISRLLAESKSDLSFQTIGVNLALKNKVAVMKALSKQKHVTYGDLVKLGLAELQSRRSTPASPAVDVESKKVSAPIFASVGGATNRCVSLF
ncbi:MAG: hypothetical protein H7256_16180 [Bdellovibrio sp.]|nr:hypothetical protein [Bdellovibrio sp.]